MAQPLGRYTRRYEARVLRRFFPAARVPLPPLAPSGAAGAAHYPRPDMAGGAQGEEAAAGSAFPPCAPVH